jgi:hypothetical protein
MHILGRRERMFRQEKNMSENGEMVRQEVILVVLRTVDNCQPLVLSSSEAHFGCL